MDDSSSVTTWLRQLKAGENEAASQLWEAYFGRLVRLARRKLAAMPRRASDEEDVALAAFNSFCGGVRQGRFPRLNDRDDLWQVLVMITVRKAADEREFHRRQKRGGGRVRGESVFLERSASGNGGGLSQIAGRDPTPEFAAEVAERLGQLLQALDNESLRSTALLKMEGWSNEEIAQRIGCGLRTVERKLSLIRRIWRAYREP
jgi:DNA-directed RNA polymerase specialized sigma24 family protein